MPGGSPTTDADKPSNGTNGHIPNKDSTLSTKMEVDIINDSKNSSLLKRKSSYLNDNDETTPLPAACSSSLASTTLPSSNGTESNKRLRTSSPSPSPPRRDGSTAFPSPSPSPSPTQFTEFPLSMPLETPVPSLEEKPHSEQSLAILQFQNRSMYYTLEHKNRMLNVFQQRLNESYQYSRALILQLNILNESFDIHLNDLQMILQHVANDSSLFCINSDEEMQKLDDIIKELVNAIPSESSPVVCEVDVEKKPANRNDPRRKLTNSTIHVENESSLQYPKYQSPLLRLLHLNSVLSNNTHGFTILKKELEKAKENYKDTAPKTEDKDELVDKNELSSSEISEISSLVSERLSKLKLLSNVVVNALIQSQPSSLSTKLVTSDSSKGNNESSEMTDADANLSVEERLQKEVEAKVTAIASLQLQLHATNKLLHEIESRLSVTEGEAHRYANQCKDCESQLKLVQRKYDRLLKEGWKEVKDLGVENKKSKAEEPKPDEEKVDDKPEQQGSASSSIDSAAMEELKLKLQNEKSRLLDELNDSRKREEFRRNECEELRHDRESLVKDISYLKRNYTSDESIKSSKVYKVVMEDLKICREQLLRYQTKCDKYARELAEQHALRAEDAKSFNESLSTTKAAFAQKEESTISALQQQISTLTRQRDEASAKAKNAGSYNAHAMQSRLKVLTQCETQLQSLGEAMLALQKENSFFTSDNEENKSLRLLYRKLKAFEVSSKAREQKLLMRIDELEGHVLNSASTSTIPVSSTEDAEMSEDKTTKSSPTSTYVSSEIAAFTELVPSVESAPIKPQSELEEELEQSKLVTSSLIAELDDIAQRFDEVNNNYTKLLTKCAEKERTIGRLWEDRVRMSTENSLIKGEHAMLKKKADLAADEAKEASAVTAEQETLILSLKEEVEKVNKQVLILNQRSAKQDDAVREITVKNTELVEENSSLRRQLAEKSTTATESERKINELNASRRKLKEQLDLITDKLERAQAKVSEVQSEIERLRKQLKNAPISSSNVTSGGGASGAELEVKELKHRLKCNVCSTNDKDCIITKCWHLHCSQCVEENIASRNRKCPSCKISFGKDDVKKVYGLSA